MRAEPEDVRWDDLRAALADGWAFHATSIEYRPIGGGGYHWIARDGDRRRRFVTLDDLERKPWLGSSPDAVFDGLGRAYGTAARLAAAGLDFVIAPQPDVTGRSARRLSARYALSMLELVEGRTGSFGNPFSEVEREAVVRMLARLHQATPQVLDQALSRGFALPGRDRLQGALQDLDQIWVGGPFSERTRRWLVANTGKLSDRLAAFDALASAVAESSQLVITHGEPHQANLIWTPAGPTLIDWDTAALAPPERDLWLIGDWQRTSELYSQATRRPVDGRALRFYSLAWLLTDVAAFVGVLRASHEQTADTQHAWEVLSRLDLGSGQ